MAPTVAIVPATPASARGLSIGVSVSGVGLRLPPTSAKVEPTTLATTTTRQRRDRRRPSGNSRNGRVTPRAMAGAQVYSPSAAVSLAARGSGRPAWTSWPTQGRRGTTRAQSRPEAAYSQPIGLAGRRKLKTSPIVA